MKHIISIIAVLGGFNFTAKAACNEEGCSEQRLKSFAESMAKIAPSMQTASPESPMSLPLAAILERKQNGIPYKAKAGLKGECQLYFDDVLGEKLPTIRISGAAKSLRAGQADTFILGGIDIPSPLKEKLYLSKSTPTKGGESRYTLTYDQGVLKYVAERVSNGLVTGLIRAELKTDPDLQKIEDVKVYDINLPTPLLAQRSSTPKASSVRPQPPYQRIFHCRGTTTLP